MENDFVNFIGVLVVILIALSAVWYGYKCQATVNEMKRQGILKTTPHTGGSHTPSHLPPKPCRNNEEYSVEVDQVIEAIGDMI
jgi:hypothetical protein